MLAKPEREALLLLNDQSLLVADLVSVARHRRRVEVGPSARQRVEASHAALRRLVSEGREIYGLTTGVGALDCEAIDPERSATAQKALLRSHAAGIGQPLAADVVRAGMLTRAKQLCAGVSGIQMHSLLAYLEILNSDFEPVAAGRGSLGAADLCSLAEVALVLVGEGAAMRDAERFSGAEVLAALGLQPNLAWRDAFALIAAPAMSTGLGALLVHDASELICASEVATALAVVGQDALSSSWQPDLVARVAHEGADESASRLRELLAGTLMLKNELRNSEIRAPLSVRSAHRIHGAARDACAFCYEVVTSELNAAIDNPNIGGDGFHTNNAASFHAQELAQAFDFLSNALISSAVVAERRIARAQRAEQPGAVSFLIAGGPGNAEHSGAMIAHYTAASLVAELRMYAVPAGIQSMSVCHDSEDHTPMTWLAATRLRGIVELCEQMTAIELWTACRSITLRGRACPPALLPYYEALSEIDDTVPVGAQLQHALDVLKGAPFRY